MLALLVVHRVGAMYDRVVRLCHEFPDCDFTLNGGILDVKEARMQLYSPDTPPNLHGVMIGRGALANPCMLVEADALYGDELPGLTRRQALDEYCAWLEERHAENGKCTHSIHQVPFSDTDGSRPKIPKIPIGASDTRSHLSKFRRS